MSEASALPLHNRLSLTAAHIVHGIRAHALLYIFAAFVCAVSIAESLWLGLPIDLQMVMIFSGPVLMLLGVMIFFGLVLELIRLNRTNYPGSAVGGLWIKIRDDYLSPQRVSNSIHAFLFMTLYMVGFSFIKKAIPLAVPFSWDETFMRWDQVLHFGRHPYEWLAPLLNLPWVTFLINANYNIWFFVMFTCWYWQGFAARDSALRMRFLLGFTLTWFIGTSVLGTIFSSVGPCFYGRLLPGVDPYAPLMAWLNEVNQNHTIFALTAMNELWKNYETGTGLINGISAMPSMHVGASILFAILGFSSGKKWLGYLMSAFAFLIFIGSIHLGWHYAIDGYAGAAVAIVCWWMAGKIVDWDRRKRGVAEA
ncbi:MAG: phosphatase PAP2 family protein [Aestuariivirga sp.]|nr:phosphatase PAP2 family protein [Aestuariivirga sp.]